MNTRSKFIPLICLVLPLLVQAETVTIRADKWFPMNGDPNVETPGYMIEMAQEILARHGHTVDYKTLSWEQSLEDVRAGKFDCVVGAAAEDAPDFLFPEESWGKMTNVFYVRQGSEWTFAGIERLPAVRLGVIEAYSYDEELDAYIEANKSSSRVQLVSANNALGQNIKKLTSGRIDATVESDVVMAAKLKEMGMTDEVVAAGNMGEADDIYIACSPAKESSKKYIKLLSEGVKKLRNSGRLKAILEKYGLTDWQQPQVD